MGIEVVSIIEGTDSPVGDGMSAPIRALVRFDDQSTRRAIVKLLPAPALAAELFCAALLRGWGLDVPEVAIVRGDPMRFASLDTGYPSLKQRIGLANDMPVTVKNALALYGAKLVASFKETPRALVADEAIANRDRNLGNLLWDGSDATWIDHERALGVCELPDQNLLASMSVAVGEAERVRQAAVAIAMTLGPQAVEEALSECADVSESAGFADQVKGKLTILASMVLRRFPQPNDLLSGPVDGAPQ